MERAGYRHDAGGSARLTLSEYPRKSAQQCRCVAGVVSAPGIALLWAVSAQAELEISGVDDAIADNVRAFVQLADEPCDAEPWRIQRRFSNVERQAREALEFFGYYDPEIESSLNTEGDCWTAAVRISAGQPVLIRDMDVQVSGAAVDDAAFDAQPPRSLRPGLRLNHGEYEGFKRALQFRARQRGYVDARFAEKRLDIWPEDLAADITLHFDSGARYRVGEISVDQETFDAAFLDRYIRIQPGDHYDADELSSLQRSLNDSGYFRRVLVLPKLDAASNEQIPIDVTLTPLEKIEYTIGAGFATDTGPRLRAGYRNRRVNRKGHRFNASLRASPVQSGIIGEFRQPLRDPRAEWLSYTGAYDRENTDTSESNTARLGVRRSKRLSDSWIRTLSLDYAYESFVVADTRDDSRLVLPGIAFDHKSGDKDLYPSFGLRLAAEVRGSHTAIGSSTSFLQLIGRVRWIHSLGEKTRLITRASIGWTQDDEFDELPPSVRFFAGGDETVRGFGFESLGPEDEAGEVIGGKRLAIASVELERQVRGNFYGALFVDAGNAFNGSDVDPAVGVGLGLKWRSPIGAIRLYLAHPLNKSDQDVRVHISLGPEL